MRIIVDIGHTKDKEREHPNQFDADLWQTLQGHKVLELLGLRVDSYDSIEHRLNEKFATVLGDKLKEAGHNVDVIDFPNVSNSQDIAKSIAYANARNPELYISIHANAVGSKGWEKMQCKASGTVVLYASNNGKKYAEKIASACRSCRKANGGPDNRCDIVAKSSVAVLKKTYATAVLVETCFYDNIDDLLWLLDNMNEMAQAIVNALK